MGRRSRKRGGVPAAAPTVAPLPARPHATPKTHRAPIAETPKAPWSPFPLVELCVLIAIVLVVLGFITDGPRRGALLAGGIALASLAGLEISIREHFAGFRSHTTLLAASCAVGSMILISVIAGKAGIAVLALVVGIGVLVFVLAFYGLRQAFVRRSGGLGFR
jgi:hypothetical protein